MRPTKTRIQVPRPQHSAALRGFWRSTGYGLLLSIEEHTYTLFEETAISCLPVHAGALEELAGRFVDLALSPGAQAFSVRRITGVTQIRFRRLKGAPPLCRSPDPALREDPRYNFDVFWHHFAEHYALFDLKRVDWAHLYQRYRPLITPEVAPKELFATLSAMLGPLQDGHVRITSSFAHFNAGAQPVLYRRLGQNRLGRADSRQAPACLAAYQERLAGIIRNHYLGGHSRRGACGLLEWGKINTRTGYLSINAMAGLSRQKDSPTHDIEVVDMLMDRVLSELGHLATLVIDLRRNSGGYDGVALRIAGYLVDRRRIAFTKAARYRAGFTGRQRVHVSPARKKAYGGRIFLLTSELTSSAAEIFVLSLLQRPRVMRIGEPTQGILSDTLERHLPVGWHLTLSNEIYLSHDGRLYEGTGIPPHVHIPYLTPMEPSVASDPMLEHVLQRH